MSPLVSTSLSASANRTRVHAGLTWVGNRLYVVGGFSEFVGDDRRPTVPRDDVHCYDPETNSWKNKLMYLSTDRKSALSEMIVQTGTVNLNSEPTDYNTILPPPG
ncbi:unnamed protein product [Echinostoma caproni]|uniref:Kelch repeat protein n=1 Tax=Echinostoma caproni TaxID=27848 RepID=A0A3P8HCZ0_9TREM|nr:unnamed protein product [Echinostoma caproni]